MHGTAFQAKGTVYVKTRRQGLKPGSGEELRVGGWWGGEGRRGGVSGVKWVANH